MRFSVWTRRQLMNRLAILMVLNMALGAGAALALERLTAPMATAVTAMAEADDMIVEVQAALPEAETEPTPAPTEDRSLRVEVVRTTDAPAITGKRILIYHTHTWEAFAQVPDAPYRETEKWRTKDNACNMVAVGDALAAALTAMGFEVVHDVTAFEPPELSSSYQRSLKMLEERQARGETFDLYIDLHRDAFSSSSAIKRTVNAGGETLARLMVLVGKGESYAQQPDWQANLTIAQCLTDCLNAQVPELCRDVKVKTGRFNQHIAPHCVLIECGCNFNTLAETLASMPYLAEAIRETLMME